MKSKDFNNYPGPANKSAQAAQFGLTPTNSHGHSGASMDGDRIKYSDIIGAPTSFASPIYSGVVNSDGTAGTFFPSGWTSTTTGTGIYKITHNLGTTNYSFVGVSLGGVGDTGTVAATLNANNVTYSVDVASSGFENAAISFIITTQANP